MSNNNHTHLIGSTDLNEEQTLSKRELSTCSKLIIWVSCAVAALTGLIYACKFVLLLSISPYYCETQYYTWICVSNCGLNISIPCSKKEQLGYDIEFLYSVSGFFFSTLSLIGSISTFVGFLCMRSFRSQHAKLVACVALSNMIVFLMRTVEIIFSFSQTDFYYGWSCHVLSLMSVFGISCWVIFNVFIVMNFLFIIGSPDIYFAWLRSGEWVFASVICAGLLV